MEKPSRTLRAALEEMKTHRKWSDSTHKTYLVDVDYSEDFCLVEGARTHS
jgi:hypothetical protein